MVAGPKGVVDAVVSTKCEVHNEVELVVFLNKGEVVLVPNDDEIVLVANEFEDATPNEPEDMPVIKEFEDVADSNEKPFLNEKTSDVVLVFC